jgi:hypothetical protein
VTIAFVMRQIPISKFPENRHAQRSLSNLTRMGRYKRVRVRLLWPDGHEALLSGFSA